MPHAPLVTVVVPTKDSARTLEACLASVRAQTHPNIELVVADNFSTDATPEIATRHADLVLTVGPERCAQRNAAARAGSGAFVAFIDSDMTLAPGVIAACVEALAPAQVAGAVIPEDSFGSGFWAQCKALERSFYEGIPWMEAARFFRRADVLDAGGYDESLVSGEDWDLSQRMSERGVIVRVRERIRHDEGTLTLAGTLRKKAYYARRFAAYAAKPGHAASARQQTGVLRRYALFFSHPRKLFARPLIGAGMLFMKTCEFAVGGWALLISRP